MNSAKDWAWMLVVGMVLGASAHAAKIYSFTGKVSQISGNEVQVTRGSDVREFSMSGMTVDQKDGLKVGEQITIWYSMEAQSATHQQAGRVANPKNDAPSKDLQKELQDDDSDSVPPNIQDDRAFYNAKVDLKNDSSLGV
jgi:hypothetical protein